MAVFPGEQDGQNPVWICGAVLTGQIVAGNTNTHEVTQRDEESPRPDGSECWRLEPESKTVAPAREMTG